jgi:hypothetical protein
LKKEEFNESFKEIIWVSYRRNFPPMYKSLGKESSVSVQNKLNSPSKKVGEEKSLSN